MGEVYRARDTKLRREVAIKVPPEGFAHDTERLARFRREAQLLAQLNHANIAAIYGLEQFNDIHFLVLDLVRGETLRERILGGPSPVDEALAILKQIAEALEAAHEKGIVHRDLKPANIKVTPEGQVKVLDFGLAKALAGEAVSSDPSESPALSAAPTVQGKRQLGGSSRRALTNIQIVYTIYSAVHLERGDAESSKAPPSPLRTIVSITANGAL